ncbi:hypothetical protein [Methylorubrum suomiense]|uniref:Uncharacterized protein n=1 Tax=Methylorubrum suomiense TaxID=144191 RepID=A0ABQ4V0U6_9HYPH|nr:hypothetical protein [Methylorubrum suomiense]GJE78048.1 hypothetical protein BGCPKDLD_4659 [Methylorubrum suomiense]
MQAALPRKRVITPDGTVIQNGVSRPAGVCRAGSDPRDHDPNADPVERASEGYRRLTRRL